MSTIAVTAPATPASPLDQSALLRLGQGYPRRRTLRSSEPAPWPGLLPAIAAVGRRGQLQGRHVATGTR